MIDFTQKARHGRIVALSSKAVMCRANPQESGIDTQFRSAGRHDNVVFQSRRAGRHLVLVQG